MNHSISRVSFATMLLLFGNACHHKTQTGVIGDVSPVSIIQGAKERLASIQSYSVQSSVEDMDLPSDVSTTSTIMGISAKTLRIEQNTRKGDETIELLAVFDGQTQWVEMRTSKETTIRMVDLTDTATPDEPFKSALTHTYTGFLFYQDYPGTLETLLGLYDFSEVETFADYWQVKGKLNKVRIEEQFKDHFQREANVEISFRTMPRMVIKVRRSDYDVLGYGFIPKNAADPNYAVSFSQHRLNESLDPKLFQYVPPEGSKVEDLTQFSKSSLHMQKFGTPLPGK